MPRKKRKRRLVRPPPVLLFFASMRYHFAQCELDIRLHQLHRDGTVVGIEPKVFDVLAYLLQHRDRMVSKDELLDKLWPGQVVSETTLTRCITSVRKAVGDDGTKQEIIATHHGRGYRFVATVTELVEVAPVSLSSDGSSRIQVTTNGQSSEALIEPLPCPLEESQKAEEVVSNQFSVASRVGIAHRKRVTIVATGLVLVIATLVVVRYLPFSTDPRSLTPDPQTAPQALPLPDKPSIIVLPFTNLSGDPGQEYFSDGLTDGIITELSRIPQLFVIARQSAFTYKGKQMRVQEIGREMGVRYVLEGSVQKVTGRLRILAQLSDATTGEQLWAERYDLELSDTMTVQEQIRQKIATLRNEEKMKN